MKNARSTREKQLFLIMVKSLQICSFFFRRRRPL